MTTTTPKQAKAGNSIKSKTNPGVTARFITPTRKWCEEMLATMPEYQRNLKGGNFNKLCYDMRRGEFWMTGNTIVISDQNKLIDGQHRLKAFLETDYYPEILVVTGVFQDEAYKVMDSGAGRSAGDVFKAHGIKECTTCATASNKLLRLQKKMTSKGNAKFVNTNQDLLRTYYENEDQICFWKGRHHALDPVIARTTRIAINVYMEDFWERDMIKEFWDEVESGIGNSVAISLRKALSKNANKSDRSNRRFFRDDDYVSVTLYAMRLYQDRQTRKNLKLPNAIPYFH